MLGNGFGPWRASFIHSLNMQFLIKNLFSFSACNSKLIGYYFETGGQKEMLSILADQ
jgi:hypothetical protein